MWDLRACLDHILACVGYTLDRHGAEDVELFTDEQGRICIRLPLFVGGRVREDGRRVVGEWEPPRPGKESGKPRAGFASRTTSSTSATSEVS